MSPGDGLGLGGITAKVDGPLTSLWQVLTSPKRFFLGHTPRRSSLIRALVSAASSGTVGLLALGVALVRALGSSEVATIMVLVILGGLPYLALLWLLGGFVLMRPAALDLRAWEITAWAWTPAGLVGLLLSPLAWFVPLAGLVLGSVALPLWHLTVVNGALGAWSPARAQTALFWYLAAIFALPTALSAGLFALFTS